ncbi:hypothetical protein KC968_02060 [Candidatus Saccharibacteria bacterium]|nr:hypothetical protein [Candidatus Saccharibacteria bacterium]
MEFNPSDSFADPEKDHEDDESDDTSLVTKKKRNFNAKTEDDDTDKTDKSLVVRDGIGKTLFQKNESKDDSSEQSQHDALTWHEDADDLIDPTEISDNELREISQQIIENHSQQIEAELANVESGSLQEAELLGAVIFLEDVAEELADGNNLDDERLNTVTDDTLAIFDGDVSEASEGMGEANGMNTDVEYPSHLDQVEDDVQQANVVHSNIPASSLVNPSPTTSSRQSSFSHPSMASVAHLVSPPSAPNVVDGVNIASTRIENFSQSNHRGADLLVGGIVGYLIGRRRGRIKTEARLIPIQQSLESKVRDLSEKVSFHEQKIRTLVSEKMATQKDDAKQEMLEKARAKVRQKSQIKEKLQSIAPRKMAEVDPSAKAEIFEPPPQPQPVLERTEKVAAMLISSVEQQPEAPKEQRLALSDAEVLRVASVIAIDGQSAKQLYEQGRVSHADLKEIVSISTTSPARAERMLRERMRPLVMDSGTHERLSHQGLDQQAKTPLSQQTVVARVQNSSLSKPSALGVDALSDSVSQLASHDDSSSKSISHAQLYIWILVVFVVTLLLLGFFF